MSDTNFRNIFRLKRGLVGRTSLLHSKTKKEFSVDEDIPVIDQINGKDELKEMLEFDYKVRQEQTNEMLQEDWVDDEFEKRERNRLQRERNKIKMVDDLNLDEVKDEVKEAREEAISLLFSPVTEWGQNYVLICQDHKEKRQHDHPSSCPRCGERWERNDSIYMIYYLRDYCDDSKYIYSHYRQEMEKVLGWDSLVYRELRDIMPQSDEEVEEFIENHPEKGL